MDTASQVIVSIVSGVFVASVASAVTAHFAFRRFYSERWWERKAAAYTDAIEALYALLNFPSTLWEVEVGDRAETLTAEQSKALEGQYLVAQEALYKALAVGSFTLSDRAIEILRSLQGAREDAFYEADQVTRWMEESRVIYDGIQALREEARRDLKVEQGWLGGT